MRKTLLRIGIVVMLAIVLPFLGGVAIAYGKWPGSSERRYDYGATSGHAPDAAFHDEAIVQVYAARAARWRGVFGVHSWIAYKKPGADHYVRAEVIGWGARYRQSVVVKRNGTPDQYWYGQEPELLADIRGEDAEAAIRQIEDLVEQYSFEDHYKVWPGPNSNTFTAHIAREVDALDIDLPPTAVGKDYIDRVGFETAPSKTGFQFLAHGLFGVTLALEEGFEVSLMGATYGVDMYPPALKLPGVGRLGF